MTLSYLVPCLAKVVGKVPEVETLTSQRLRLPLFIYLDPLPSPPHNSLTF